MANLTWEQRLTLISLLLRSLNCYLIVSMPIRVLLSLHDEVFEALIADFLFFCNYEVHAAYSQKDALTYCQSNMFDIAVVDVNEIDDVHFIEYLRTLKPDADILALVLNKVPEDIIQTIPLPKEQLLPLPVPLVSILEGIKVLNESRQSARFKSLKPLIIGSLCIDKQTNSVRIHGQKLALTQTEFLLLNLLADNINLPVSKDDIYPKVLGRPRGQYDRAIDVHISSVRHKLLQLHCDDLSIESVRGVGYRLCQL